MCVADDGTIIAFIIRMLKLIGTKIYGFKLPP
jgi:hypothetical protein